MRSKFSDLIDNDIAPFKYTNTITNTSDRICKEYNNLFSIHTDTHMSVFEDGYIITGNMHFFKRNSITNVGKYCGYYDIFDFFRKNGLTGGESIINGDNVYVLNHAELPDPANGDYKVSCPTCYYENFSNIPHPLNELITNRDVNILKECYKENDINKVVECLNNSPYIKGNWIDYNGNIYGKINNTNIRL